MNKKYQIFISSTYDDLKLERQKVQEAILSMHQFPIGMEMFSAADEEQWEVIRESIDSSDYYILLLAHRYGSVIDKGSDAGISYTEKEYRYAKAKGIPILAFLKDETIAIPPTFMEKNLTSSRKLNKLKKEIKDERPIEWWIDPDELGRKITVALFKQINKRNRPGWVRSTIYGSENYGLPVDKSQSIPMYLHEDQDTYHFFSNAKEIIFCARTGKSLLNGHYNILKEFIHNGGTLKFLTSENFNLVFDDYNEHPDNKNNSITFLRSLSRINNDNVMCKNISQPINITMLYVKTAEDKEFIELKFIFQTKLERRHPLTRIDKDLPYFDIFYNEIINLWEIGTDVYLGGDINENSN